MAKIEDIKIKIDASDLEAFVRVSCSNISCPYNYQIKCNLKNIIIGFNGRCLEFENRR